MLVYAVSLSSFYNSMNTVTTGGAKMALRTIIEHLSEDMKVN